MGHYQHHHQCRFEWFPLFLHFFSSPHAHIATKLTTLCIMLFWWCGSANTTSVQRWKANLCYANALEEVHRLCLVGKPRSGLCHSGVFSINTLHQTSDIITLLLSRSQFKLGQYMNGAKRSMCQIEESLLKHQTTRLHPLLKSDLFTLQFIMCWQGT